MDSNVYISYRNISELYWDNGWQRRCVTVPPSTSSVASGDRGIPELAFEDKAELTIGNHVLALPYWNVVGESVIPKVAGIMQLAHYMTPSSVPVSFGTPSECLPGWNLEQRVTTLIGNFGHYGKWTLPELPEISDSELKFLIAAADTKALANAKRAELNIALIMKERRETLQMVSDRVAGIAGIASKAQRDALREWRNAPKGRKRKVAEKLANLHLELVFGFLPLMSDIEDICKQFTSEKEVVTHIKVRGTHAITDSSKDEKVERLFDFPGCSGAGSPDAPVLERRGSIDTSFSVRTALRFEIKEQWLQSTIEKGFDPIGFAFDSYPLSFVSGWISNFDSWVRTLSPLVGLEFVTGSRTIRRESRVNGTAFAYPITSADRPAARSVGAATGTYTQRHVRWDREVLHALPSAELQWQNNFDWFSITAAASLLVQKYNKPLARALSNKRFWRHMRKIYTE